MLLQCNNHDGDCSSASTDRQAQRGLRADPEKRMIGPLTRTLTMIGVLVLYLWPRYFFVTFGGKGVSGYTLTSLLLFVIALAMLILRPDARRAFIGAAMRSWVLLLAFLLLWLWRIACDFMGLVPSMSYWDTALDFLYLGVWFITASILFGDRRLQSALPYLIAVAGLVATLFGILESVTATPVSNLLGFYDFSAGDQYMLANLDQAQTRGGVMRVKSLFAHPIVYGQILGSMAPIALHFLLQERGWRRSLGAALGAAVMVSIVLCNARSPFFVAVAASVVYFAIFYLDIRRGSRLFVLLWAAIAFLVVAPMATGVFLEMAAGRTSEEAMSSNGRAMQRNKGEAALATRPINGFGDGAAGQIAGIKGRNNVMSVDDYYLTTEVNTGYLGFGLLIAFLACATLKGIRLTLREPATVDRSLNGAYTGAVVGLGVGLKIISIVDPLAMVFLMAGVLVARSGQRPTRAAPAFPRPLRFASAA